MGKDDEEWRGVIVSPKYYWLTDIPALLFGLLILLISIPVTYIYSSIAKPEYFWAPIVPICIIIAVILGIVVGILKNTRANGGADQSRGVYAKNQNKSSQGTIYFLILFGTFVGSCFLSGVTKNILAIR